MLHNMDASRYLFVLVLTLLVCPAADIDQIHAAPVVLRTSPAAGATGAEADAPVEIEMEATTHPINPLWIAIDIDGQPWRSVIRDLGSTFSIQCQIPEQQPYQWVHVSGQVADTGPLPNRTDFAFAFQTGLWPSSRRPALLQGAPIDGFAAAADARGNLHIALVRRQCLYYAVNSREGWYSEIIDPEGVSKSPSLAVSSDGTVHVLWLHVGKYNHKLRYTYGTAGGFNPPFEFATWMFEYSLSEPYDMKVDAAGRAHLLWVDEADPYTRLYHTRMTGGVADPIRTVSEGVFEQLTPRLVMGEEDLICAVWLRKQTNYGRISLSFWDSGRMSFNGPEQIPAAPVNNVRNPAALPLPGGAVLLFWEERQGFGGPFELRRTIAAPGVIPAAEVIAVLDEPVQIIAQWFGDRLRLATASRSGVRSGVFDDDGRYRWEWVRRRPANDMAFLHRSGQPGLFLWTLHEAGEFGLTPIPGGGRAPRLSAAGLVTSGNYTFFRAVAEDPDGDIAEVRVYNRGVDTGLYLFDDGFHADGAADDGLFGLALFATEAAALLGPAPELIARDRTGHVTARWPALAVRAGAGPDGP